MVDSCVPLPDTKPVHSSRVVGERKEGTKSLDFPPPSTFAKTEVQPPP
jgi:hypothetical protein